MQDYEILIINDGRPIMRDGDVWTCKGTAVNPREIIRDLVSLESRVVVQAFRADGDVDVIDYVDGKHYHTTYGVNRC